jgi:hypothetical protein
MGLSNSTVLFQLHDLNILVGWKRRPFKTFWTITTALPLLHAMEALGWGITWQHVAGRSTYTA